MRALRALIIKESLQIMRDPSSILIALVLPLILLFIFGYGVNLDNNRVKVGLVLEEFSPDLTSLATAMKNSPFFDLSVSHHRQEFDQKLADGYLRGIIIVPQNFLSKVASGTSDPSIQVIADGSEPNIASFVQNYAKGVIQVWLDHQRDDRGQWLPKPNIQLESRFWYNPELKSRNFLIPGSIAIILTLIGTMLTALVIAREWERGTMEALLATPVTIREILLGKLVPYFILGICSMAVCFLIATFWYDVPFEGSFLALLVCTSIFLIAALGQGLFISSAAKDQFMASQMALMSAFLPAFMLSGFIFEIAAMPKPIQALTHVFAARYFVTILQTLFLSGDIWPLLLRSFLAIAFIAFVFYVLTNRKMVKRLDI